VPVQLEVSGTLLKSGRDYKEVASVGSQLPYPLQFHQYCILFKLSPTLYNLTNYTVKNTFKKHGCASRIIGFKWGKQSVKFRSDFCSPFLYVIEQSELCENNASAGQHMSVNEDSVERTVFGVSASVSFIVRLVGIRTSNLRRPAF
jgi:hypothetical protein